MKTWMIRGVLAASLLVCGMQGQALAQSTVEAVGFVGAATDNLGTTFGGGMNFGAGRLIFSAEVGLLSPDDGDIDGVDTSGLSIDLDAQYRFPLANNPKLTPYVLGGIGILRFSVSGPGFDESDSDTGVNLGGGVRFQAGTNWGIRPEVKFWIHDDTATRISVAAYYSFGK